MFKSRQTIAIALLAAVTALAQAQDAAKKDPKSGKSCVTYMSSELTATGQTKVNFRNVCASAFEIQLQAGDKVRKKGIEAGSPEKPAKISITCKPEERCETAKWEF